MKKYTGLEIAVIGISGRFPGADNVKSFWDNLRKGVESISFFTDEELLQEGEDPTLIKNPNYVKANSFLEDKENFDSTFFNYRPDEARLMDPQMRLFHECVWEALEDAGCNLKDSKNKVSLFAGSSNNINWQVYSQLVNRAGLVDDFSASQLSNSRFLSSRISYCLNLKGPSIYMDTACSTSLVAIHEACKSLLLADCNIAVAGGVTVTNKFKRGYIYSDGMIYSKDGHCRTFDADSSGTIGGEGAAVVVLKTLKNALKDGDNIWAVIKGSGINNDGNQKVGYAAPSIDGQIEAIMRAQKWAKVEPESIGLIEAHGTATELGDPIEIEALNKTFGKSKEKYCAIGSVKSNLGHLDAAAGAAGLIKAVLALKNKQLPPSLNFTKPNSKIDFNESPFYVNTELREWKNDKYPLRAGVSSFGIGGTNAHAILEEAPELEPASESREYQVLLLSAKTPAALQRNCDNLKSYLQENAQINFADIAHTLQTGRTPFAYRKAFVCKNGSKALELLSSESSKPLQPIADDSRPSVVFMFSGQGSQYINMCRDLYLSEETFRKEIDACFEIVKEKWSKDLKPILFSQEAAGNQYDINNTEFTQPLLFIVEYSLAKLMMKWGVTPDIMIGHSIGEYVAACISGLFTIEDALFLVIKRGELMQQAPQGVMLSISISESELLPVLTNYSGISLAAINSSELCVVSGTKDSIEGFASEMEAKGYKNKLIRTSHAFHSHMMDGIQDQFKCEVDKVKISTPKIPFVSNLSGELARNEAVSQPQYWVNHLRQAVKFSKGVEMLLKKKNVVFVEVGPGEALCTFVRTNKLRDKGHKVISLVKHPKENSHDLKHLLTGIGELWVNGIEADWCSFYETETRKKVSLPTYSFDKVKYPVNVDAYKMISEMISENSATIKQEHLNLLDETSEITLLATDSSLNPTEGKILTLWQNFFGKSEIDVEDDFFDIGGDSLKALTMVGRLQQVLNIEISLSNFFKHSSARKLSAYYGQKSLNSEDQKEGTSIPSAPKKDHYALSSAQQRQFFLFEFDKTSLAYNLPQVFRVTGVIDREKLNHVFNALVERHESLRTYFELAARKPVQKIAERVSLEVEEYTAHEATILSTIKNFIRPFDLSKCPLIRVGLIEVTTTEHMLMVDVHHIVADGVSFNVLINDFMILYNGGELKPLHLQYKDFAEWQQSEEHQKALANHRQFWMSEFSDEVATLNLPTDFSRPAIKGFEGDSVAFEINKEVRSKLKSIVEPQGATMYMGLLSIYAIFLSKLSSQTDIVIGTPTSGRQHGDFENILGMFVNTLPIRSQLSDGLNFSEFLSEMKGKTLASVDHQAYPFEALIDELQVVRDTSHNPLFDVMFSYRTSHKIEHDEIPGLSLQSYSTGQVIAQFDITLFAVDNGDDISLHFEYSSKLFKRETIERFVSYFQRIVSAIIADEETKLAAIEIIPEQEKQQVLKQFNNTQVPFAKDKTIHAIFEQRVQEAGDSTALVFAGESYTYEELNKRSNQVARAIQRMGVKQESVLGILLPRSVEMLASILGVLKAGCAYIPLDPEYPADRIKYIVEDSGLSLLLTNTELQQAAGSYGFGSATLDVTSAEVKAEEATNLALNVSSSQLAYMIYTSGSTGHPKGVMIEHRNVINFVEGITSRIEMSQANTMLCLTTISFDIFVLESILPLLKGMQLVLASAADQKEATALSNLIKEHNVDLVQITPSHLKLLLSAGEAVLDGVKVLMVGGEAFLIELLKTVQKSYSGKIYNMYGPTETTVWSTVQDLTKATSIDIGTPIANTTIRIIDTHQNLQPIGIAGELCIGGEGVGRGYWKKEALTEEKFIVDPVGGNDKVYRTGDLARWMSDGSIEYLGRIDNQVKIRGYRIELGEIENQLTRMAAIQEAVVYVKEKEGDKFLVAYYVSAEEQETSQLRRHLSENLPEYMVPSYFVYLEKLPLTPNGKIDRRSLPDPEIKAGDAYQAPTNEIEEQLVAIWSEVLKLDKAVISVNRSFFEMGGNSLKASVLVAEIHKELNIEIQLKEIFSKQSVESLSDYIITAKQLKINKYTNEEILEISI